MSWFDEVNLEFETDLYSQVKIFQNDLRALLIEIYEEGGFNFKITTDGELCNEILGDIKNEEEYPSAESFQNSLVLWKELEEIINRITDNRREGRMLVHLVLYSYVPGQMADVTSRVMAFLIDKYPDTETLEVKTEIDIDVDEGTYYKKYVTLAFTMPSSQDN